MGASGSIMGACWPLDSGHSDGSGLLPNPILHSLSMNHCPLTTDQQGENGIRMMGKLQKGIPRSMKNFPI